MPNIEIHGFDCQIVEGPTSARQRIKDVFRGTPFFGDIATEVVLSRSQDLEDNHLPYLRVWDTSEERAQTLTNILRMNGFRVERPVVLEEYVEPPMWSEAEIAGNLQWLLKTDWLKNRISGTSIMGAINSLKQREYEKVATFYVTVARALRTNLGGSGILLISEIEQHVLSARKKIEFIDENSIARLVMFVQIIFSLMPECYLSRIFPAS